jgi:hypothetical protein
MNKFFEGLTNEDMRLIKKIADRYVATAPMFVDPVAVVRDITVYHQNYHRLDLRALAGAKRDNTLVVAVGDMRHHIRNHPVA